MAPLDTKLLIAEAFVELCENMPLQKVSISDIVEKTGKNRKTFYYHFEDKGALIVWKFRYDLGLALQRKFPENALVYEKPSKDSVTQFPYYITQKSGSHSLNHSKFFDVFAGVLEHKRSFYTQALLETGPHALRNYLYRLYQPALRRDIGIILGSRTLPEENVDFLSEFYTCAFLYYFIRKCDQPTTRHLISNAGPFSNIIHSSLESEINDYIQRANL
jgi:AcrR family transcriptional regulator